jgi:transcriptional regulator with XRE-family HTH domain
MPRKKKKPQEAYGWATGTPHPVDVHVGQRLRLRRKLSGLSQTELGEKIGVTFQQLQKYESGANRISASRLFDLSRVLDVPVSYFFDEMTENVSEAGKTEAALTDEPNLMAKRETLELARAYTRIADPKLRQLLRSLVTAVGRD